MSDLPTQAELQGKSLTQLMGLLREVPVPDPVPMWPQTPGWIVLGAGVMLALAALIRWRMRHHRANAYRRAALTELSGLQDDPAQIATLLRRTALAAFPRAQVAGLQGAEWLHFLDDSFAGDGFATGPGQILTTAPYRPTAPDPALTALARDWIRTHKGAS